MSTLEDKTLRLPNGFVIQPVEPILWRDEPIFIPCDICNVKFNRYTGNYYDSWGHNGKWGFICNSEICRTTLILQML